MSFEEDRVETSPPFLQKTNGIAWNSGLGLAQDEYVARAKAAVKARWPRSAPSDALDYIGSNFQINRGFAPDDQAFVKLLEHAWSLWGEAGRKPGLQLALADAGITNFEIWEKWEWADGETRPERWWEFWVVIHAPFPWTENALADGKWEDAGTWDSPPGVWTEAIPWPELLRLRALIRKWKPSHAHCRNVILVSQGNVFGELDDVTWDNADAAGITWTGSVATYVDA